MFRIDTLKNNDQKIGNSIRQKIGNDKSMTKKLVTQWPKFW